MAEARPLSVGIDIGGTFTDVVVCDARDGSFESHKEPTTPEDPTAGVAAGLRHLARRAHLPFRDVGRVVHATTLFTNALIERRGAPTGLITTEGFRDVLEIGRERKYELYDVFIELPRPLVPRHLRLEVSERMTPAGEVLVPLDTGMLLERCRALVDAGVTSIAIVFLHAYANPVSERLARDVLKAEFPGLFVSISSEVAPQIREYERASTTVANAYIQPLASRYVGRLDAVLKELGIGAELFLMLSNGGFTNAAEAERNPIQMLESGPAAGSLAGAYFGLRSSCERVLAFDMGGTTAKLSVIDHGQPQIVHRFEAGREQRFIEGSGLPLMISTVELIEIGAGGGSIAETDELGLLKVGPRSAGSEPGPACYGRGGRQATVTDANVALGYLDPATFSGGSVAIRPDLAHASVERLTPATHLDTPRTAWGIYDLVNETMASAARVHVSERGGDPRRYSLLTTGGGGPLHGCEVARKLGIDTLVCPPSAGVASALGLLMAPTRIDRVLTVNTRLDELDPDRLTERFHDIERRAFVIIAETGIPREAVAVARFGDLRYLGQGFELIVALPPGPLGPSAAGEIRSRFEDEYRTLYGRTPGNEAIELVSIRVSLRSAGASVQLGARLTGSGPAGEACKGKRPIFFGAAGGFTAASVYDRARLGVASVIDGPALIEEPGATLLLPPGSRAAVEPSGNIVVRLH